MSCDDAKLLTRSEVLKLSYGKMKAYVKNVGLELPSHVTKYNCKKLIFTEKKYIEDKVEKMVEEVCPSSIEYKKGLSSPKSPSEALMSHRKLKNQSSSESSEAEENSHNVPIKSRPPSRSIILDDEFLQSSGSAKVNKLIKRMKREFPIITDLQHFKAIQNCVYGLNHLNADELCTCVEKNDVEGIGPDAINTLAYNMARLHFVRWTSAINHVDLDAINLTSFKEKFQRFFRFVKIPQVYEKIRSMGRVHELRISLHESHKFTHHVYTALTEIISEPELIRYLMSVLLFCRVGESRQISLSTIGLDWNATNDPTSLHLLKQLMKKVDQRMSSSVMHEFERFDRFTCKKKKKKVTRKMMGGIMVEHFRQMNKMENEEIKNETTNESEEGGGLPTVSKPMTALMSEMRSTVVDLRSVVDEGEARVAEEKRLKEENKSKMTESMKNIKAIEFCVPKNDLLHLKNEFELLLGFLNEEIFIHKHAVLDEFSLSLNRLEETNDEILELWKETERTYLSKTRTKFLRKIADPHFQSMYEVLLDVYDIELSDDLWGEIWAFRQPYEKKVDLRFAIEVFKEFKEKHDIHGQN